MAEFNQTAPEDVTVEWRQSSNPHDRRGYVTGFEALSASAKYLPEDLGMQNGLAYSAMTGLLAGAGWPGQATTLWAKCDVYDIESETCVEPTTEVECQAAAEAARLTLGGGGRAFAGDYTVAGCITYTSGSYLGMAYWSTGTEPVVAPELRVSLCGRFPGGYVAPPDPCESEGSCCGIDVLSNDHTSGVAGGYLLRTIRTSSKPSNVPLILDLLLTYSLPEQVL